MITYAPGEKDILLNSITNRFGIGFENAGLNSPESQPYIFFKLYGSLCCMSMYLLTKIVLYDPVRHPNLHNEIHGSFKEVWNLIHFIPLNRVPLYINTIPDIASWRLKIGK
jgi:hypothetical protein